jgi:hypothetical protein
MHAKSINHAGSTNKSPGFAIVVYLSYARRDLGLVWLNASEAGRPSGKLSSAKYMKAICLNREGEPISSLITWDCIFGLLAADHLQVIAT